MGRLDHEIQSLLPLSSSSSSNCTNNTNTLTSDEECAPSDNEDIVEFEKRHKRFRAKLAGALRHKSSSASSSSLHHHHHQSGASASMYLGNRRRFLFNRGLGKRFVRLLMCAFLVPMLLFVILYSSMFTGGSSRQFPLPDWEMEVSRNISDYVLPFNDTTLLEPRQKCEEKFFVLIVVCSSLNNFEARQTIRETWGNSSEFNYQMFEKMHSHLKDKYLQPKTQRLKLFHQYLKLASGNQTAIIPHNIAFIPVRIVFLLGYAKASDQLVKDAASNGNETQQSQMQTRLRQEAEQYDDIIQEQFLDSYNNLTIKSVMALKWIQRHKCYEQAAFFMKCDDDTFINVPNLLHFLLGGTVPLYNETLDFYDSNSYQTLSAANRLNATTKYIVGYKFCKAPVLSNVKSKWYMPYYMYAQDEYPQYLSGSGYLMSMDVVPQLWKAALNTSLIYLEDVYVTGMCAEKAHLRRHHHPLFNYSKSKHACTLRGMITMHKMTVEDMYASYNFVTNTTHQCAPPGKYFKRIRLRRVSGCG